LTALRASTAAPATAATAPTTLIACFFRFRFGRDASVSFFPAAAAARRNPITTAPTIADFATLPAVLLASRTVRLSIFLDAFSARPNAFDARRVADAADLVASFNLPATRRDIFSLRNAIFDPPQETYFDWNTTDYVMSAGIVV
jgi:hypothetical protein